MDKQLGIRLSNPSLSSVLKNVLHKTEHLGFRIAALSYLSTPVTGPIGEGVAIGAAGASSLAYAAEAGLDRLNNAKQDVSMAVDTAETVGQSLKQKIDPYGMGFS